mmetsp:Transcript_14051/g.19712  ORF Transcript_14051/g.19712 Transcript_14051/m.19712 type:complete len:428 (+) Transcript_14051:93-1376(+)|eukprot:jgi/Bigna1/84980/estExt_fgenesh1_pg.C_10525
MEILNDDAVFNEGTEEKKPPMSKRLLAEKNVDEKAGAEDYLYLRRSGIDNPEEFMRARREEAKPLRDRYYCFKPLEAIPIYEEESDEKAANNHLINAVFEQIDPEKVDTLRRWETPSEEEKRFMDSGKDFDPTKSVLGVYNKAAGDLMGPDFALPYYIPYSVPLEEQELFLPGIDDIIDDYKAWQKMEDLTKGEETMSKKLFGGEIEDDVEEYSVSATDGKTTSRFTTSGPTGRDTTPFFQICFVRVGVAFGSGFGFGGLIGAAAVYQSGENLSASLRRTQMFNSFLSQGTRWGNSFGVLAFLYTGYYVAIRDYVYAQEYFKGDSREMDKEWFLINSSAGALTGLTYKLNLRKRRAMLLSAALGAVSCAMVTQPFRFPSFDRFADWMGSKFYSFRRKDKFYAPIGLDSDEDDEKIMERARARAKGSA